MMIIFPLGHEVQLRRLPKVTLGIIAVNVVVFLITYFAMKSEVQDYFKKQIELAQEGVQFVIESQSNEGDPLGSITELNKIYEAKTADEGLDIIYSILKQRPEEFEDWLDSYKEIKNKKGSLILNKVGFIPAEFPSAGFFSHIFIHAGWFHLIFNMWFLYLAGCCIEDTWGRFNFLGFYLLGGFAAASLEFAMYPNGIIPMVGASGAVAAAMGAFAVRYSRAGIDCLFAGWLLRPVIRRFTAPAWLLLFFWFAVQLFYAEMYRGIGEQGSVAFWAHVGGFAFGALFATFFKYAKLEDKYIKPQLEKLPEYQDFSQNPDLLSAIEMIDKGEYVVALSKLEQILINNPKNIDAQILKARTLFFAKYFDDSYDLYISLMNDAKTTANKNLLCSLYNEYTDHFPGRPLPENLIFAAGRAFFEQKINIKAEACFYTLIGKEDTDHDIAARALLYLARTKIELQFKPEEAKQLFLRFLEKYPDHAWASQARKFADEIKI